MSEYWTKDVKDGVLRQEKGGRSERRFMDEMKKHMQRIGGSEKDPRDMIHCSNLYHIELIRYAATVSV